MHINSAVRKLLLDPLLRGDLSVEVDEFVLATAAGPISVDATLLREQGDRFTIELRDPQGRDLSSFFPTKSEFSRDDALTSTGTIGAKVRIRIEGIWPPSDWSHPIVSDVKTTTARLTAGMIRIPTAGLDELHAEFIVKLLGHWNSGGSTDFQCEIPEREEQEYEHLAVFSDTKLKFRNGSQKWSEDHPFWGKSSGWKTISWDGEAFGGTFSLMQDGEHLKVGFRHKSTSAEEAKRCSKALFFAIGYTHAINPWPAYLQVREGGRVIDEHMRPIQLEQGKFVPLWESHGDDSDAPTRLIAAVAEWLSELSESDRADLKHAYWVFRSADHKRTPAPTQLAMIGAVIEGLFDASDTSEEPASFVELRNDAIEWLGNVQIDSEGSERSGLAKRLAAYVQNWKHQDRRTAWKETFSPLFPERQEWLDQMFALYKKHRHQPAHGDFVPAMKVPLDTLRAIGRLAGFVNLVIAAKAGYEGPILESPISDALISLEPQRNQTSSSVPDDKN